MIRSVSATRYVTPLREGGSLPAIVEADDDGLYVVKFSGAGQGPRALVAELIAGELARALGLPLPELVLIDVDEALGRAEPDPEIQEVILRSAGVNIALDYLPGSVTFNPAVDTGLDAELAADIIWFDSLVTNPDRMPQNPNLLMWHDAPWLIDHGAALFIHHGWIDVEQSIRQPFDLVARHVLLLAARSIVDADERLAPQVTTELVTSIVAQVPDDWLTDAPAFGSPDEQRTRYVGYIMQRLEHRAAFVARAEEARRG